MLNFLLIIAAVAVIVFTILGIKFSEKNDKEESSCTFHCCNSLNHRFFLFHSH
jgi:hypothetical protein